MVRLGSVAEGEADSQSQDLEEDEELRGCLGRQQVNKVRTVGYMSPLGLTNMAWSSYASASPILW